MQHIIDTLGGVRALRSPLIFRFFKDSNILGELGK